MRIIVLHPDSAMILGSSRPRSKENPPIVPLQFEIPTGTASHEKVMAEMAEARKRFNARFGTMTESAVDSIYEAPPRNKQ